MSRAAFGLASDGLDDAAVEAFDEAIGVRTVWSGQPGTDLLVGTDQVEGMTPGWTVLRLIPHVDGEAVGELTAVVGEDGVNRVREVLQEALEEAGCRLGMSPGMDFQIDETAGAVDGDEGVTFASFQCGQVFEIDVNEADRHLLEGADGGLVGLGSPVEARGEPDSDGWYCAKACR
ncbi:MAG: hypothetical protein P8Y53_02475 [Pseudolabrys sp.]